MRYDTVNRLSMLPSASMPVFSPLPPDACLLAPERIDVWKISLEYAFAHDREILDANELFRADRFLFDRHRRRFVAAHAAMRRILACYLGTTPQSMVFTTGKHGKPRLSPNPSGLEFNLSHSGELALLAVGQTYPLGVDIECYSGRDFEGIADSAFAPGECEVLNTAPTCAKAMVFFDIWSRKEAFIKAIGMGLSCPTPSFEVLGLTCKPFPVRNHLNRELWHLRGIPVQPGVAAALCYHPSVTEYRFATWAPASVSDAEAR